MSPCYIIDSARLTVGKKGGIFKNQIPEDFTAFLIKQFLNKNNLIKADIQQVILGCALGTGGNMARYTALQAGLHTDVFAQTIDTQCASGLSAIALAFAKICSGSAKLVLAGGMESCSLAPIRQYKPADKRFVDEGYFETASFAPKSYGESSLLKAAENVALKYNLSKTEMQNWLIESHKKANIANEISEYLAKIIAYEGQKTDRAVKHNLSIESLQATEKESLIDHTNTAHLHDGAGITALASQQYCQYNNIKPSYKIRAVTEVGIQPNMAPMASIMATEMLLKNENLGINEIQSFEVNESFAVNPLAFVKHFGLQPQKLNLFGGNLAYGHPFGASGAINFTHLLAQMDYQNTNLGLVTVPAAGGLGVAMLIERIKSGQI